MFILEITATNYRNVSCETVKFSQPCTFLVGENSLGALSWNSRLDACRYQFILPGVPSQLTGGTGFC